MASLDSLNALLEEELKDLYDAEKQLTKALPKMARKASSPDLKAAIEEHLQQTETQVERIERAFEALDLPARGKKCIGMQYLIKEGNEMIAEAEDDDTRDAVMIAAAQKVEHYEIAGYGTARTWANLLGYTEVASLLEETLDEEKEADEKLTGIAESHVNQSAADEDDEQEAMMGRGRQMKGVRRATTSRTSRQQAADRARANKRRRR